VELAGAVVLVTGGSRGIGRAIAELAARRGARVVSAGRDAVALQEVADASGAVPLVADLSTVGTPDALVREVLDRLGRLDAVVACAGVGHAGPVADMPPARVAELVDVNVRGTLLLARAAVDAFREQAVAGDRRARGLAFVTSIAGAVGVPGEAVYSATKAAVESFAAVLREELRADGGGRRVAVSTVLPGAVDTGFFDRRGLPYERRFPRPIPAARVAEAVVASLEGGTPRRVVPRWLAVPAWLAAALPGPYRALARRLS
jgi:NAD(P)-dependent dehydrogenase (short-subunit alcohol dehydrogenase family)